MKVYARFTVVSFWIPMSYQIYQNIMASNKMRNPLSVYVYKHQLTAIEPVLEFTSYKNAIEIKMLIKCSLWTCDSNK